MKKIFTPLFAVALSATAFAGTPVINGVYDPAEGWGAAVGTGDGVAGWAGANAKKLYVTYDNNYVYYAAEVSCDSWMQFMFVVNTKPGGTNTDAWGRTISYDHAEKPDFIFRGDIAGSNYAEYHVWNGTAWTNTGSNINGSGTEVKSVFSGTNGFVEIRVPRSLIGAPGLGDVQFIIGGNNGGTESGHGCFDAIPDDNNGTSWNAPGNFTSVSKYVSNVTLPLGISRFAATKGNGLVNISFNVEQNDGSLSKVTVQRSADGNTWSRVNDLAINRASNSYSTVDASPVNGTNYYRLTWTNNAGRTQFSQMLAVRMGGNNQGWSIFPNPVKDRINLEGEGIQAGTYQYRIMGLNGQVMLTGSVKANGSSIAQVIAVPASFTKGRYTMQVIAPGGQTQQLALIKE